MERYDLHIKHLLAEVEAGGGRSQRSLARELGIALGLTNLLLRRVMRKGWVKATNIQRNRCVISSLPQASLKKFAFHESLGVQSQALR